MARAYALGLHTGRKHVICPKFKHLCKLNRLAGDRKSSEVRPKGSMKHVGLFFVSQMAGMGFVMEELPGGDIMLKRAVVVPTNERLLDPAVHAELEAAREWRRNNPAKATDLAALGAKLGITEE